MARDRRRSSLALDAHRGGRGADIFAGGSDGRLYQLDIVSPSPPASVILGDGTAAVGVPTLDLLNSMIYVGTDQGVIYGVLLPLP